MARRAVQYRRCCGLLDDSTHCSILKKLLALAAIGETATGLALVIVPSLVVRLLFGVEIVGVGVVMSSVVGIALIGLGVACWPGPALLGMLTYGALVTLYFLYLGIRGEWVGPLLWPAVVLHAVLTFLLARTWFKPQQDRLT